MRSCGVLLHITSLPSPYGIGTFGADAEAFVDWLKESGQSYWQVLPIGPTGYGESPYSSFSTFAGNPLMIDLDDLIKNGLIKKEICEESDFGADPSFVDFEKVYRTKLPILREAFSNFSEDVGYLAFIQEQAEWLEDYSLFMAVKSDKKNVSWTEWENEIKLRRPDAVRAAKEKLIDEIKFWKFIQYTFFRQWEKLKRYANMQGIKIIGDIPIYVAMDSADVWSHPELFQLDGMGFPTSVAGVPPDYFSETGQLWGNPLYNWDKLQKTGYAWWIKRIQSATKMYDIVRIDHFRAFDTYYSIPYGEKTAINGVWETGPGMELFNAIEKSLGKVSIIAEDLGDITDSVRELLKQTGFPGMRVIQFGFNPEFSDNDHLPHRYPPNCVAYTGTHDNSTSMQWVKSADRNTLKMARAYVRPQLLEPLSKAFIRTIYQSSAGLVIIPMQDILGLGKEGRMNTPSTLGNNWIWRMKKNAANKTRSIRLKGLAQTYYRV